MKKNIFLFLALLAFSCYYCSDSNILYKNNLKEVKVNTVVIQKRYNNKIYNLKVSVGESYLGIISSLTVETVGDDNTLVNILLANKDKIKENIKNILLSSHSVFGGAIGPVVTIGDCVSKCTSKWSCNDKPTDTGALLCNLDCALECMGA